MLKSPAEAFCRNSLNRPRGTIFKWNFLELQKIDIATPGPGISVLIAILRTHTDSKVGDSDHSTGESLANQEEDLLKEGTS